MRRENFNHGFAESAWTKAKQEALVVLKGRARKADPITYGDLVKRITAIQIDAHDSRLAHLLGELSTEEHNSDRPLITALVVHKHDLQPGKGFFDLARSLGFAFLDEVEFWSDQIAQLQSHWSKDSAA